MNVNTGDLTGEQIFPHASQATIFIDKSITSSSLNPSLIPIPPSPTSSLDSCRHYHLSATILGEPNAAERAAPQGQLRLRWSHIHRSCADDERTTAIDTLEGADSEGLIDADVGDTQWVGWVWTG